MGVLPLSPRAVQRALQIVKRSKKCNKRINPINEYARPSGLAPWAEVTPPLGRDEVWLVVEQTLLGVSPLAAGQTKAAGQVPVGGGVLKAPNGGDPGLVSSHVEINLKWPGPSEDCWRHRACGTGNLCQDAPLQATTALIWPQCPLPQASLQLPLAQAEQITGARVR